jgi:hypothetical protein
MPPPTRRPAPTNSGPKMSADIPVSDGTSTPVTTAVSGRSPVGRLDGRTKLARRSNTLFKALTERLGNPTDAMIVADCRSLVELKVLAERARGSLLGSDDRSSTELGRIEFLIRHAEARLGLEPGAAAKAEPGSWEDLFVEEQDEEQPAGEGAAV